MRQRAAALFQLLLSDAVQLRTGKKLRIHANRGRQNLHGQTQIISCSGIIQVQRIGFLKLADPVHNGVAMGKQCC